MYERIEGNRQTVAVLMARSDEDVPSVTIGAGLGDDLLRFVELDLAGAQRTTFKLLQWIATHGGDSVWSAVVAQLAPQFHGE